MTTNEALEKVINQKGGRLSSIAEEMGDIIFVEQTRIACERYKKYTEAKLYDLNKKNIHFVITAGDTLNAFACSVDEENDLVGIPIATILILYDIFLRMLSHPNIFPDVGNSNNERAGRALLSTKILPTNVDNLSQTVFPLDPLRFYFASMLAQTAMGFLIGHEIAHLRNGHLEFKYKMCGINNITEIIDNSDRKLDALISQTLEMDADSGGLIFVINEAFRLHEALKTRDMNLNEPPEIKAVRISHDSPDSCIETIWFVIYTFFRLFDSNHGELINVENMTHPSNPVRQILISDIIESFIKQRPAYGCSIESYDKMRMRIIIKVEQACSLILGDEVDPRGIFSVIDAPKLYQEYTTQLLKKWGDIRPELENYKRGGNLPPAQTIE